MLTGTCDGHVTYPIDHVTCINYREGLSLLLSLLFASLLMCAASVLSGGGGEDDDKENKGTRKR